MEHAANGTTMPGHLKQKYWFSQITVDCPPNLNRGEIKIYPVFY